MAEKESAMNYPEHDKTYALFIALAKYGTISVIVILVFMALFLV